MTLKDELPKSVGTQYVFGEEWRNNSRKNEQTEPKQKQCPDVDENDSYKNNLYRHVAIHSEKWIVVGQQCAQLVFVVLDYRGLILICIHLEIII